MIVLSILYILIIAAYIFYARRSVDKVIPKKVPQKEQEEHLKRLRHDRFVGDFVLTGAAIPAIENTIVPVEGYRIYKDAGFFKINGGCQILISVSAEKMKSLFLTLMQRIGPVLSVSVEDHYSNANKIVDYLSYDRDAFMIENLIERYWRLLQNNYDVQLAIFSTVSKVELVLTRAKAVHIHAVDSEPFISTLKELGFIERPNLQFFTEESYYVYNDYVGTGVMHQLVSEVEVHEKRFYEKVPVTQ